MRFLSLFSGCGGLDHGLVRAGHECIGYVELDKFAHQSFEILHDPERRLWSAYDIRSVTDDDIRRYGRERGPIQIIAGGFPCQAFSVAGKREGFADRTRGTLFFEVARFASILRPEYLLLENVDGLRNHDGGRTLGIILSTLDELGYMGGWQVLNSKDFGVPQNRERIFIIASLGNGRARKVFPIGQQNSGVIEVIGRIEGKGHDQNRRIYAVGGVAPCLNTMGGGGQEPKVLVAGQLQSDSGGTGKVYHPDGIAPTQLAQHGNAVTKIVDSKPTQFSVDGEGIAYCLDTGYAKNLSPNEVGKGKRTQVVVTVGNVNPSGKGMNGNVFDANGLAPTLTTNKGEGVKVLQRQFAGQYGVTEDVTGTLQASRVDKVPMVVEEPRAVLTPDRMEKRQNGRRMKEPGEPMFTLTAQDLHGVAVQDVESGLLHGRGFETRKDGISHCLKGAEGGSSKNFLLDKKGYRIRKLTPLECFRLQSWPDSWYVTLKLFRNPELIELVDMSRNNITNQVLGILETHGVKEGISDSQLYKMAGNGVTSNVAYEIGLRIQAVDSEDSE